MTVAFAVVDCAPHNSLVVSERKSLVAAIPSFANLRQRRCMVAADDRIAHEMVVFIVVGLADESESRTASDARQQILTSSIRKCVHA